MDERKRNMGEEYVLEDILDLENASLFVELGSKRNVDLHSEMLETMRSLKADMESIKADNLILMNTKSDQKEINELILKILTEPPKTTEKTPVVHERKGET